MGNIVIAEDEALVSHWLEVVLSAMGHRVAGCVNTSESAVKLAVKIRPDLLIMDNLLAGDYDGIRASELIGKEAEVPVLFISSAVDSGIMDRMKAARPAGILIKPFRDADLHAMIDLIIQRFAEDHALRESREFIQNIVDHIPHALAVLNDRHEIISWNGRAEMFFGYAASDVMGEQADTLVAGTSKDILNSAINTLVYVREPGTVLDRVKLDGVNRDGSVVPVEMSLSSWEYKGEIRINSMIRGYAPAH